MQPQHDNNNMIRNRLLALLPATEYARIAPLLEQVDLSNKERLYERNQRIRHVYFPGTAMISVLALMENGTALEIGSIGNEGMAGLAVLMGHRQATETMICQIPEMAYRMRAQDLAELTLEDTSLRRTLQAYTIAYLSQVSQSVACNRLHSVEERFARWLLMTQDRVCADHFVLTQEFIARCSACTGRRSAMLPAPTKGLA